MQCLNYWRGPAQTNHQIFSGSNCFLLLMSKIPGTTYVLETPGPFWVRFMTFILTFYMFTIIWFSLTSNWLFPFKLEKFPFIFSSMLLISRLEDCLHHQVVERTARVLPCSISYTKTAQCNVCKYHIKLLGQQLHICDETEVQQQQLHKLKIEGFEMPFHRLFDIWNVSWDSIVLLEPISLER